MTVELEAPESVTVNTNGVSPVKPSGCVTSPIKADGVGGGGGGPLVDENVALTLIAAFIVTLHGPVPLHAPVQPLNCWPAPGVSVSATTVPGEYAAEHVPGQTMPPVPEVTVPIHSSTR